MLECVEEECEGWGRQLSKNVVIDKTQKDQFKLAMETMHAQNPLINSLVFAVWQITLLCLFAVYLPTHAAYQIIDEEVLLFATKLATALAYMQLNMIKQ